VTSHITPNHPATAILSAFIGLAVGKCDAGEECATSDVVFEMDKDDREYLQECVEIWNELLSTSLIVIAWVHREHGALFVDSTGRMFDMPMVQDAFFFCGESFEEAMRCLLFGRRISRPMLRPDQEFVFYDGKPMTVDHPLVYKY
jgi:hypothetical protein